MTATVTIAPVRTASQYEKAKARISALMGKSDQRAVDELDILGALVEKYERENFALEAPTPLEAIRFRMAQARLKPRDLEPFIGGRSRVSEVFAGKRPLSLDMIRSLHRHLGIPAEVLIGTGASEPMTQVKEPSAAALQRLRDGAFMRPGESFAGFVDRALGSSQADAFWRKSRTERTSAKTDHAALAGWLAAVRLLADEVSIGSDRRPSAEKLGRRIAKLSVEANGPQRAKAELAKIGIVLVTLEHLPGTYLDGAALCRNDGAPVIALTLRHDRIDNFWFTLLHELCHVLNHIGKETNLILDDLELRSSDEIEAEADLFAQNVLIPPTIWDENKSADLDNDDVDRIAELAGVHPAIVAGRWQREHGDYRRFARSLGRGEIRSQFYR
ncbi:ImmA/IrrE family metallo-endopeptidase [Tsuneonella rigui]|uniref:ImmA/IrrE family metallo-endopeptidase n=1 Tax=Tsuneonella rigui TaxID=1708790 RepID=UPI000F7DEECE|nr:ImmA/IrrE family metallo-endopeptidase [Tsuneonella rigui]